MDVVDEDRTGSRELPTATLARKPFPHARRDGDHGWHLRPHTWVKLALLPQGPGWSCYSRHLGMTAFRSAATTRSTFYLPVGPTRLLALPRDQQHGTKNSFRGSQIFARRIDRERLSHNGSHNPL